MNRSTLASLCAASLLVVACGAAPPDPVSLDTALKGGGGGGGGPVVRVVAAGRDPVDTAPDSRGREFYFIGSDRGGPGIFRARDNGGAPNPVHVVASGAPLARPRSLVVSGDDDHLFVADRGADAILVLAARSGRHVATLAAGYDPRGVELGPCGGESALYFTGRTPRGGAPGLFRVDERGRVETVAAGFPFAAPDAVAVDGDGVAYVSDTPGVRGGGRVLAVDHGAVSVLAAGLTLGSPAGVALTRDGRTLLVSGVDGGGHSQVYLVDTATGATATFAGGGIGDNTGSGGVHRAAERDVFGWAGINRNGGVAYFVGL